MEVERRKGGTWWPLRGGRWRAGDRSTVEMQPLGYPNDPCLVKEFDFKETGLAGGDSREPCLSIRGLGDSRDACLDSMGLAEGDSPRDRCLANGGLAGEGVVLCNEGTGVVSFINCRSEGDRMADLARLKEGRMSNFPGGGGDW